MPAPSTDDQIAHALLRIPGVRAVLLGGSRATGVADAASDTDLYALRSGPPAPEGVRAGVLAPFADGGTVTHDDTWGVEDRLHHDGRLVEVMHFDLAEFRVDEAFDPGLDPNGYTTAFLHTLARGVPLADPYGDLTRRRARLARRAGVDPAVVSAPFITTLVDATGLMIYFTIAGIVFGL